jgi:hypothetical protein
MKKSILVIIVSVLVLVATIMWLLNANTPLSFSANAPILVVLVIVVFGLYVGYSRLKSEKRGEPAEDEMSKRIMLKTSSMSFYISLYWWLAVSYFSDRLELETHSLINGGILGMAVIFCLCWIVFKLMGVKDV